MYDVVIVGGGIAGLTAAIYCGRYKLKTLVLSKDTGGIILDAYVVENWPGFKKISGQKLMQNIEEQVKELGIKIEEEQVEGIEKQANTFRVKTKKNKYDSKTVIIASGTERRKLNVPGEAEFTKKGVNYCATCDAPMYAGKTVALIGGGNSAVRAAQILSEHAKKIYMIFIEDIMIAEPILADWVRAAKKIELYPKTSLKEIKGDRFVNAVVLTTGKELKVEGVFVEIGFIPSTKDFEGLRLKTDKKGFIEVDKEQKTNVSGVFAAGDISNASNFKQLLTAASQGAVAANSAYIFLK